MNSSANEAKLTKNELLKNRDPSLGGTILRTLVDPAADRFSEDDEQFLKFHGIYQQDDRDKRKTGKEYIFMIRGRIPGGIVGADQYRVFDDLASRFGNNTLRITTRQSFQWHGVVKRGLGPLMKGIHDALSTTIAACGDVVRNVMAPPTPATGPLTERVLADAAILSRELAPTTRAYHQIWVDGVQLNLDGPPTAASAPAAETANGAPPPAEADSVEAVDPLYGRTYLPRKFKTAFAIPPLNDTDIFTNCLGFVAIADPADPTRLLGYNLLAGGGLGMSHGNKETFPRLADVIGFFAPEHLVAVAKAVVTVHRDFGDRTNRKHARLKYVLQEKGGEWFRGEVEARAGLRLAPAHPIAFTHQGDLYGWHQQADGRWFLGLFVETGRIKDTTDQRLKTALRLIAERFRPEFRLTASQNILLANVAAAERAGIDALLAEHGVAVAHQASTARLASMACPALPTCGLALAESERWFPQLLSELEQLLASVGLDGEEVIVRITGCPNGCARPYMAEVGLVGRAPNKYNLYLGGSETGTRINRLYRESVKGEDVINELRPVLVRFAAEREPGERFGEFCTRHAADLGLHASVHRDAPVPAAANAAGGA